MSSGFATAEVRAGSAAALSAAPFPNGKDEMDAGLLLSSDLGAVAAASSRESMSALLFSWDDMSKGRVESHRLSCMTVWAGLFTAAASPGTISNSKLEPEPEKQVAL